MTLFADNTSSKLKCDIAVFSLQIEAITLSNIGLIMLLTNILFGCMYFNFEAFYTIHLIFPYNTVRYKPLYLNLRGF